MKIRIICVFSLVACAPAFAQEGALDARLASAAAAAVEAPASSGIAGPYRLDASRISPNIESAQTIAAAMRSEMRRRSIEIADSSRKVIHLEKVSFNGDDEAVVIIALSYDGIAPPFTSTPTRERLMWRVDVRIRRGSWTVVQTKLIGAT